jgi:hypothetical protein
MNGCCDAIHSFDACHVAEDWWPSQLKYLIVGETPSHSSPYFYARLPDQRRDPVRVRRNLLDGLVRSGHIAAPTLPAFKEAGFLFDHAIRCRLSKSETKKEWRKARQFRSDRAHAAHHLAPVLAAVTKVWIMGWLALDAVAHLSSLCAGDIRAGVVPTRALDGKFFVSRYLLHIGDKGIDEIIARWRDFIA